jgi:hypothetical protein
MSVRATGRSDAAAGVVAQRIFIEPRSGEMSERSERKFASEQPPPPPI